jgi:hypothetical protein
MRTDSINHLPIIFPFAQTKDAQSPLFHGQDNRLQIVHDCDHQPLQQIKPTKFHSRLTGYHI